MDNFKNITWFVSRSAQDMFQSLLVIWQRSTVPLPGTELSSNVDFQEFVLAHTRHLCSVHHNNYSFETVANSTESDLHSRADLSVPRPTTESANVSTQTATDVKNDVDGEEEEMEDDEEDNEMESEHGDQRLVEFEDERLIFIASDSEGENDGSSVVELQTELANNNE